MICEHRFTIEHSRFRGKIVILYILCLIELLSFRLGRTHADGRLLFL